MRRKLLSMVLTLAMVLTMAPGVAIGAYASDQIDGEQAAAQIEGAFADNLSQDADLQQAEGQTSASDGAFTQETADERASEPVPASEQQSDENAGRDDASLELATVSAAWDGTADISWYNTTSTSFTLTTAEQLAGLAKITSPKDGTWTAWTNGTSTESKAAGIAVDNFLGKTVSLGADLDLGGYNSDSTENMLWYPIADVNNYGAGGEGTSDGTFDNVFWRGTFDGCGHTISNVRIDGEDAGASSNFGGYQGFFSCIGENGIIKNLGISSGTLYGRVSGGICAIAAPRRVVDPSTGRETESYPPESVSSWPRIMNCWTNMTITGNGSGSRPSGGIFGGEGTRHDWVCLINCYVRGATSNGQTSGGCAGFVNGVIAGCYNTGSVVNSNHGSVVATLESVIQGDATKLIVAPLSDNTQLQPGLFVNNMALQGTCTNFYRFGGADNGPYNAVTTGFSTAEQLKNGASALGSGYVTASSSVNNGYPVLFWQSGLTELSIAGATVDPIPDQDFCSGAVQPFPVVKLNGTTLTYGTDYLVQWDNNINPGVNTASLTVIGVGRYTGSLSPVCFTIKNVDYSSLNVSPLQDAWVYDSPVTPIVTVTDPNSGNELVEGQDYAVAWSNNDKEGTATATITSPDGSIRGPSVSFGLHAAATELEGSGTQADPYLISDRYEWQFAANQVNTKQGNYPTAYYELTKDIDLTPLSGELDNDTFGVYGNVGGATYYAPFCGTFDGAGHTVTIHWNNLTKPSVIGNQACAKRYYVSLFGMVGSNPSDYTKTAEIKNLTIEGYIHENRSSTETSGVASLIGYGSGSNLILQNIINNAEITYSGTSLVKTAGIIANGSSNDTFTNVVNNGNISSANSEAGGIYGYMYADGSSARGKTLTRVINNGDISSVNKAASGFAGSNAIQSESFLTLNECGNNGDISALTNAGGLFPSLQSSGAKGLYTFTSCYNKGSITCTQTNTNASFAAGLIGSAPYGTLTIEDCYNTGTLTNQSTGTYSAAAGMVANDRGTTSVKGHRNISGYNAGAINAIKNMGNILGYARAGALSGKATSSNPYINTTLNCLYEGTTWPAIGYNYAVGGTVTDNCVSKTSIELKAAASVLGSEFTTDSGMINRGYPVLTWETSACAHNYKITSSAAVDGTNHIVTVTCRDCGTVISTSSAIHVWNSGVVTTAPTCLSTGIRTYTCMYCSQTSTSSIAVGTHTVVTDAALAATCTRSGLTAGSHCSVCNAVITPQQTVPMTQHGYVKQITKAATCTQGGIRVWTCKYCSDSYSENTPSTGHYFVTDAAIAATCTQSGLTEGSHCNRCGMTQVAQQVVPEGHSYNYVSNGNGTHTGSCSVCSGVVTENCTFVNDVCSVCGGARSIVTVPEGAESDVVITGIEIENLPAAGETTTVAFEVQSEKPCVVFADGNVITASATNISTKYAFTALLSSTSQIKIAYKGDYDDDGVVNINDAGQIINKLRTGGEFTSYQKAVSRSTASAGLSLNDVFAILNQVFGVCMLSW